MSQRALSPQQFHQLAMFHTAGELHAMRPGDGRQYPAATWADKRQRVKRQAESGGTAGAGGNSYGHIPNPHAIEKPVEVKHYDEGATIIEGHHRTVAAYDHSPSNLVPVIHHEPPVKRALVNSGLSG